ncbi:MAG: GNAT family N-acetyltransferase [Clostridiales bacterium]|nr:GNAT family N-acetyltransferase [Clostridiales bacterium]
MTIRLAHKMEYLRPETEKATVSLVPFDPKYQDQYRRIYNACYHEMREALDIKPYDFIQDDSFFREGMGNIYLLIENGELIGSVALKGSEIDDLIVAPEHQNKGYGKQILLWALENIQSDKIILHAAQWNRKAISLYEKNGFEITETFEIV